MKHHRAADCVVVGVRWKAPAEGEVPEVVATLLLGLYDEEGELRHVGSTSASAKKRQAEVASHVLPLIVGDPSTDPVGPPNRWQQKEGLPWSAVEPEAVVEVRYDKWEGSRFRHGTRLMRFRPDKDPDQCTFEQVTQRPGPDDPRCIRCLQASRVRGVRAGASLPASMRARARRLGLARLRGVSRSSCPKRETRLTFRRHMPFVRSPAWATRARIVEIVNAAGSTDATSSQARGAEARASGAGLIE